jgi:hypothetical protein
MLLALVLLAALVSPVLASPMMPAPAMPGVDGGTVWTGSNGVFQQWDDGAWVYVWRPAPGEPPPGARWPERKMETQHELDFAGRRWSGGYLVGDSDTGDSTASESNDRVLVAWDEGSGWYVALFVPGAALDARADSVVQALKETRLEGE